MGHAQSWHALAAQQSPQFSAKLLPGRRIQRGEGLIEQQKPGSAREHARERHLLLLPTGELGRTPVFQPLEPKKANHFIKPRASFLLSRSWIAYVMFPATVKWGKRA